MGSPPDGTNLVKVADEAPAHAPRNRSQRALVGLGAVWNPTSAVNASAVTPVMSVLTV